MSWRLKFLILLMGILPIVQGCSSAPETSPVHPDEDVTGDTPPSPEDVFEGDGTPPLPPDRDADTPQDAGVEPVEPVEPIRLASLREVHEGRFATSQACADCHSNSANATAMRGPAGEELAPFDLWHASMKANASRDPLFRAVLAAEKAATPAIADAIEKKCMTCHAPMAAYEAHQDGEHMTLERLYGDDNRAQLGLDGVSCTTCHQLDPLTTGTEATFSGQFIIGNDKEIYGPHAAPFATPMANRSGFEPVFSNHMTESRLCASCHTLYTDAHLPDGTAVGQQLPEQSPYLEWRNSDFNDERVPAGPEAASCQDCHMPGRTASGDPLRTAIARRPDGSDYPPIGPREPYGQHVFVGGNTLIPAIIRDNAADLSPQATAEAFDAIIALATAQLQERTAELAIEEARIVDENLHFAVTITNLAGHKIPTAYPSRRIWLRVRVLDANGATVFQSGEVDHAGRIIDSEGRPIPSELSGGPIQPHHSLITAPDQVQIYESIMGDTQGEPTMRLMRGAQYIKDNRILPKGWSPTHPDAADTAPIGTEADSSFTDGMDTVAFALSSAAAPGPFKVEATLFYQPLSARYAAELFDWEEPEVLIFRQYFQQADRYPVAIKTVTVEVP